MIGSQVILAVYPYKLAKVLGYLEIAIQIMYMFMMYTRRKQKLRGITCTLTTVCIERPSCGKMNYTCIILTKVVFVHSTYTNGDLQIVLLISRSFIHIYMYILYRWSLEHV